MPNIRHRPGLEPRRKMNRGLIIMVGCLFFSACGTGEKLPVQGPADLIKVVTMAGSPKLALKEIREKEKIAALVAFVNELPDHWSIPWYGPPVGRVSFQFI